jgi:phospholipid/cholesterol/gamma-HCH transport system substrate-binding protein
MPYGRVRTDAQYVTTTYPDGTEESYLQERIKVSDKIGLNAQVGYRIFPDTIVRAGLIESTGGVGVDHSIKLGKRPLTLVFEAYDFGREFDEAVHLRIEGRYFISRNIFVTAGWDDPLVSAKSSVLFGGGITWADDDVKYSLGLAGGALN